VSSQNCNPVPLKGGEVNYVVARFRGKQSRLCTRELSPPSPSPLLPARRWFSLFGRQVCCSRKVNCTLVPCGHHCCCMQCAEKFDLCPVCRVRITLKVKAIDA